MTAMESVDAGAPVFGEKFSDAGKTKTDYRAARFKLKSNTDKYQQFQPKLKMKHHNGVQIAQIDELKCAKAIVFFEIFFIKETKGAQFSYRWSLNILAVTVCDTLAWLEESMIVENLPDEVTMLQASVTDTSEFFDDNSDVSTVDVHSSSEEDQENAEEPTPSSTNDHDKASTSADPTTSRRKSKKKRNRDERERVHQVEDTEEVKALSPVELGKNKEQDPFSTPSPSKRKNVETGKDKKSDKKIKNKLKKKKSVVAPDNMLSAVSAAKLLDFD